MMNVEQIALEVAKDMGPWKLYDKPYEYQKEFAKRLVSKIGADLEPVGFKDVEARNRVIFPLYKPEEGDDGWQPIYTTPAEAILAAEQRVAETITKMIADERFSFEQSELWRLRTELVLAIRSGAWREYL